MARVISSVPPGGIVWRGSTLGIPLGRVGVLPLPSVEPLPLPSEGPLTEGNEGMVALVGLEGVVE